MQVKETCANGRGKTGSETKVNVLRCVLLLLTPSLPPATTPPLFLVLVLPSDRRAKEGSNRARHFSTHRRLHLSLLAARGLSFFSFLPGMVFFRLFFSSGSDHFCLVSLLLFVVQTGRLSIAVLVRVLVSLFCNLWVFLRFLKSPKAEGT
jgi:hypothetical protein